MEQWWSSVDLRGSSGKTWFRLEGSKTAESARERRLRELKEKKCWFCCELNSFNSDFGTFTTEEMKTLLSGIFYQTLLLLITIN